MLKRVHVCQIGIGDPLKSFEGHEDEVNAVKWDPRGILLASCSDDKTAKVWSLKHDSYIHNFAEHTEGIYTLRWSPITNLNSSVTLAT